METADIKCQHRWEESNFGKKYRTPNHYMYQCKRCGSIASALLNEDNTSEHHHVQQGAVPELRDSQSPA